MSQPDWGQSRLTRWSADGTWARLLARAQADADAAGELDRLVPADSTMVRVHKHGASARRAGGNAATVPAGAQEVSGAPPQHTGARSNDKNSRPEPPVAEPADHAIGQ